MEVLVNSLKHLEKIEFNCRDEKTLELLTDLNLKSLKTRISTDLSGNCFDKFNNLEELELDIHWRQVDLLNLLQRLVEGGNSKTLKSITMKGEIWEGNEQVLDALEFICKNFENLEKLDFPYFHEEIRNLHKLTVLKIVPFFRFPVDAADVGGLINLKQLKEVKLNIRTFEDLAKIFVLMLTFKIERFSLLEDYSCVEGRYSREDNSIDLKFKYPISSEKLKDLVHIMCERIDPLCLKSFEYSSLNMDPRMPGDYLNDSNCFKHLLYLSNNFIHTKNFKLNINTESKSQEFYGKLNKLEKFKKNIRIDSRLNVNDAKMLLEDLKNVKKIHLGNCDGPFKEFLKLKDFLKDEDIVFSLDCQDLYMMSKKIQGVIKELEIISYNENRLLDNIKFIESCIDIRTITRLKIKRPTTEALICICKNLAKLEQIKFITISEEGFSLLEDACELLKKDNPKLNVKVMTFHDEDDDEFLY